MDEDAALEAQAPEGSSPEGELTGKPYSSNSIAGTNFGVIFAPFWTNSAPFWAKSEVPTPRPTVSHGGRLPCDTVVPTPGMERRPKVAPFWTKSASFWGQLEDAAPEAQAPEGSSPEGELTGKPCSSNSIAGTNS